MRGLVVCGACNVKAHAQQMGSTADQGTRKNRYYSCSHHDPLSAGGPDKPCAERRVRADELDALVFAQMRDILLRPNPMFRLREPARGLGVSAAELFDGIDGR